MQRGDLRRVPQNPALGLVGYHVACPRCGFVTPAVVGDRGLAIDEGAFGVSFSRSVACVMCLVGIRIAHTTAALEEGPGVRPVR